jgi:spore maturation protein CgeB
MRFVYFTHSLTSCWNHGNAHFLRGVLRDLLARGHDVRSFEPHDAWSSTNLRQDQGEVALARFAETYADLAPHARYLQPDLDAMLDGADVVLMHEWNDPALVAAVGARRKHGGRFQLLFHDTHHRAVSDPEAIHRLDLSGYDGVLAFGAALAAVYRRAGWGQRAFIWHEAADTRLFRPLPEQNGREGIVWIGNWGDEERSEELRSFLLEPAASLNIPLDIYGVRYPDHARSLLAAKGARYHGWLANAAVPAVFACHLMTVHVPRRFYVQQLPGIPTIRMFEALACGIPLICAPWHDSELLFRPGTDYLQAHGPSQMANYIRAVQADDTLRRSLADHGLQTIRARHTCVHRVDQLLAIIEILAAKTQADPPHENLQQVAAA